jgi:capsular polysaccharide biosynthesis protein
VTDRDLVRAVNGFSDLTDSAWPYPDFSGADGQPSGFGTGLVSLRFIKASLRRRMRFWVTLAVIGLVLGLGYKVKFPSSYQATTTILLPQDEASAGTAILADMALAQSRSVAELATQRLGLSESATSFANAYTVTDPANDVLVITATAPSAADAVRWTNAIATAFLKFRATLQVAEEKISISSFDQQMSQAEQKISSANAQIRNLSAQPASSANRAKIASLQAELGRADNALAAGGAGVSTIKQQTTLQIKSNTILDAASLIPKPRKKPIVVAAAIGLVAGLALGMGMVIVSAIVSDRLRRRDDVAYALGAPVRLSVGPVKLRRWLPVRGDLAAPRNPKVARLVAHLEQLAPSSYPAGRALAVVAVDDERVTASCITTLAVARAQQGDHVVLADLTAERAAARRLKVRGTGAVTVGERGARLLVVVPDPGDPAPIGPAAGPGQRDQAELPGDLADVYAKADLLLVLAKLDPSVGGDHLATWTKDAVVVVTAGRSSFTKIQATGEMLRLARIRVASAVLVGADRSDESIGAVDKADRRGEVPQRWAAPYGS